MRKIMTALLATSALVAFGAIAHADGGEYASGKAVGSQNNIFIDATSNSGSVGTLQIGQDATAPSNTVSGNSGTPLASPAASLNNPFAVKGGWNNVAINQTGALNVLAGSIKVGTSANGKFNAAYTTGGAGSVSANQHFVAIDAAATPSSSDSAIFGGSAVDGIVIAMTNTDTGTGNNNVVKDTITTAGNLTYKLMLNGKGNTVTNTISNTPADEVEGNAVLLNVSATGDGNSITNNVYGDGNTKSIKVSLASSGNTVKNTFGASGTPLDGTQTSILTANSGSKVDYTLVANGTEVNDDFSSYAKVVLTDVIGAASAAAKIGVNQTAAGAYLDLALIGTAGAMGTGLSYTPAGGSLATGYGAVVNQASVGATTVATVTGNGAGYTVSISQ
jgi:hypothetical protein